MKFKLIFLTTLFLLFTVQLVSSAVEYNTYLSIGDETLEVQIPIFHKHKQNTDLVMSFHVYNKTTDVSCKIHIYNKTNDEIFDGEVGTIETYEFTSTILKGNFTDLGSYYYFVHCNTSDAGGYASSNFAVVKLTRSFGSEQIVSSLVILVGILAVVFVFLFIGSKLGANDKTLPIGFFFYVMALLLVIYSLHFGWILSVDILQHETISSGLSTLFVVVIWSLAGIAIISIILMFIAFIKELGKMNKRKKFGDDFDPLTNTYK